MTLSVRLGVTKPVDAIPGTRTRPAVPGQAGGEDVLFDLRKGPHVLISGMTGSGKSVALHNIIGQLLHQPTVGSSGLASNGPDDLSLVLIDPKRVELAEYAGHPCVVSGRPVTSPQDALVALRWVLEQVETRFGVMARCRARDVGALAPWGAPLVPMAELQRAGVLSRYLVLVIDELADLVMTGDGREIEQVLARILQLGRAAGVHVLCATQSPRADVVSGLLRSNLPSRLAFAVRTATESRIALDCRGAEELEGGGDALWRPAGARNPVRIRGSMQA